MGSGICWAFHKIPLGRILYESYAFICIDEIQILHNPFAQPRHSDRRLCYGGEVIYKLLTVEKPSFRERSAL